MRLGIHLLIFICLIISSIRADSQSYYLGSGSTPIAYPFPTAASDARTQVLFTASELMSTSFPAGAYIEKIGLDVTSIPGEVLQNVKISMKNFSGVSFSGFQTGMTELFSGEVVLASTGWQDITLQNPFLWDATSSIILEFCFDRESGSANTLVMGHPILFKTRVASQMFGDGCALTTSSYYNHRPNIRLTIAPPLPAVTPFPAIGSSTLQTALYWTSGGGYATHFQVFLDTVNPPLQLIQEYTPNPVCVPPMLKSNTHYFWKVVPGNTSGNTLHCPVWDFYTGMLDTGLVGFYPFRGNSYDESGYFHHGQPFNVTPAFDRHGLPGQAALFNGNSQVKVGPDSHLMLASWTISGWIKASNPVSSWQAVTAKDENPDGAYNMAVLLHETGSITAGYENCSGQGDHLLSSSPLDLNPWQFFTYTRDTVSNVETLYINGQWIDDSVSEDLPCLTPDTLRIGARAVMQGGSLVPADFFTGVLDNIRIYNHPMDEESASTLYEREACNPPAYYSLTSISSGPGTVHLGLNGSEYGVQYQVKRGMANVGEIVIGTATDLDLGTFDIPGIYYVVGTNPCGTTQMPGSVQLRAPQIMLSLMAEDSVCQGSEILITASVTGGYPPYGYLWSNGLTDQASVTITGDTSTDISLTVTDALGYSTHAEVPVIVYPLPDLTWPLPPESQCITNTSLWLDGANPGGGTYNGPGVEAGFFNASVAGVGTHILNYQYTNIFGCSQTINQVVTVTPLPEVTWDAGTDTLCQNGPPYLLSEALPEGGTYSGPGVTDSWFIPETAGPGIHELTYTYSDSLGCVGEVTHNMVVTELPLVTWYNDLGTICANAPTFTLTGGLPPGGTYSGPGVVGTNFNATLAGTGSIILSYSFMDEQGCISTAFNDITVYPLPTVFWEEDLGPVCEDNQAYPLSGGVPAGGIYSGPGVEGDLFNASITGPGTFMLAYVIVDENTCMNAVFNTITVSPLPVALAGTDTLILDGTTALLHGSASGGAGNCSYSWSPADLLTNALLQQPLTLEIWDTTVFSLVVSDANNCSSLPDQVTVYTYPDPLSASAVATPDTLCPGLEVQLMAQASGGAGDLSYYWYSDPPGFTSQSAMATDQPIVTTTYHLMVTDGIQTLAASATVFVKEWPSVAPVVQGPDTVMQTTEQYYWVDAQDLNIESLEYEYSGQGVMAQWSYDTLWLAFSGEATSGQLLIRGVNSCGTGPWSVPLEVTVLSQPLVQGTVTYANLLHTVMSNTQVSVISGDSVIQTTGTDSQGHYQFGTLMPGDYQLQAFTSKPWGGGNSNDALRIQRHFVGMNLLSGIRLKAADVNNSGGVNSNDALVVMKRFVGLINGFPAGNWAFEDPPFTSDGSTTQIIDFKALCYGDVDGSYSPTLKREPGIILTREGVTPAGSSGDFSVPLLAGQEGDIAAISLSLHLPGDIAAIRSVSTELPGMMVFHTHDRLLRISWVYETGIRVKKDEVLFKMDGVLFPGSIGPDSWEPDDECQIIDKQGHETNPFLLSMPLIVSEEVGVSSFRLSPDPFMNTSIFKFTLVESADLTVDLYNSMGIRIKRIFHESCPAGEHQRLFEESSLAPGLYYLQIKARSSSGLAVHSVKVVKIN